MRAREPVLKSCTRAPRWLAPPGPATTCNSPSEEPLSGELRVWSFSPAPQWLINNSHTLWSACYMPAVWWMRPLQNLAHTHFSGGKTEVLLALTSRAELETEARFPGRPAQRRDKPSGGATRLQLLSQQAALRTELGA